MGVAGVFGVIGLNPCYKKDINKEAETLNSIVKSLKELLDNLNHRKVEREDIINWIEDVIEEIEKNEEEKEDYKNE